jgi:nitroreductase
VIASQAGISPGWEWRSKISRQAILKNHTIEEIYANSVSPQDFGKHIFGVQSGQVTMELKSLILKNRSYRRFYQEAAISRDTLRELVDLARLSGSASNRQPLKYYLACQPEQNAIIYPHLGWAGYLKDWGGPPEGERPSAYIIILGDKTIAEHIGCDHGIAAQSILLGATEKGLGGCMIGSSRKPELMQALGIPAQFEILLVIALGKPKETVVIEPLGPDGDIKYWRDAQSVHHVPKRPLDDIIVE